MKPYEQHPRESDITRSSGGCCSRNTPRYIGIREDEEHGKSMRRRVDYDEVDVDACCLPRYVAKCFCTPIKWALSIVLLLAVVFALVVTVVWLAIKQTPGGDELIQSMSGQFLSAGKGALLSLLDGVDSDPGKMLYRRHFSSDIGTHSIFDSSSSPPWIQGWLDIRAERVDYNLTVSQGVPELPIISGGIFIARRDSPSDIFHFISLDPTPTWPTAKGSLKCPSPWAYCQVLHQAQLDGSQLLVVVLRRGATVVLPPSPSDVFLQAVLP